MIPGVTLHINAGHDEVAREKLDQILHVLQTQGASFMAKVDELLAELAAINTSTNEIASDIDALQAQLAGGLSAEEATQVQDQLSALKSKLQDTAAKYTPEA